MPDVFISYKRERRAAAEHLAEILKKYGYDVWFDYALVKGRDFGQQLDKMIRSSKVLVVLWCKRSVGSRWVHEEVDLALELGILLPVKIEACELPVGNRRIECINLASWDGGPRSHNLDDLLVEIGRRLGRVPVPDFIALKEYDAIWRRFGAQPLTAFALEYGPGDDPHAPSTGQLDTEVRLLSLAGTISGPRDLSVLHDIWVELRSSENVDRLGRFLEQVRGTPLESAVEERLEHVEGARTTAGTADWLRQARPVLERVKTLYSTMAWRQSGPEPEAGEFEKELGLLLGAIPPVPDKADVIPIANVFEEYLNTKIHHGLPIPDDYTLTSVFPLPGSFWVESGKRVKACLRPGIHSSLYRRESYGGLSEGLLASPELVFVE
jgi:hypothetical protein